MAISKLIFFIMIILMITGIEVYNTYDKQIGPEQPIPFSHRVHVMDKKISCLVCHEGASQTSRAGIPALETCMLCHDRVIIHHPEIEKLRNHYHEEDPIEWVKVQQLPDFVFFDHSLHVFRQIDCGECHGNVREMDRIEAVHEFTMDFCMDCHREKQASIDCFTCHR